MTLTDLLWLATAAYGIHILEEYQLNWRDWARAVLGLPAEWDSFYVVNALVIVLGTLPPIWPAIIRELPSPFRP